MSIKPRNFQILFLLLSLGSVIISSAVFFVFAYQIGSDSIKEETMRTVGVAADGKYNSLLNRLHFQKHTLDNLLSGEMGNCEDGNSKQFESCLKRSMTQFMKVQKVRSLYFETSHPKMVVQLGEPSRDLVFDPGLMKGQVARFHGGGTAEPHYLIQSETADKKSRLVAEFSANYLDTIFTAGTLGNNGESFLVDPKGFFLTTHKYHVASGSSNPIDAKPMVMCLGGKSGETVGLDYAGVPIIHGFRYIPEIGGGCIMVHVDQREAFAGLDSFTRKWAVAAMVLWAVLGVISYLVSRKLAAQLKKNIDKAEEAGRKLEESEKKYRQIFHSSKAVCLLIDSETGQLFDVNAAACNFYGYTKDELLSKTIYEINVLTPAEIKAGMEEAKAGKQGHFVIRHRLSSGEVREVESYPSLVTIGGKIMFFSIVHDITDRKKAETALMNAEIKYHTLFDESPDGVLLFNTANAGLVDFNAMAHQQLGYTKEEFAGLTISDFEVVEAAEDTQKHIAKVLAEGSDIFETKHRTKDGEIRNVRVMAKAMILEGKPYIHCIFRDITMQKVAETKMNEAKEEAEEANKLKDKFIMLVSHDLKTPLVGMLGLMQLLQKQPEIRQDNQHMIDLAVQGNKRMIRMIDQLLDVNRIRSGKLQLKCRYCDGSDVVRKAVAIVEPMAAEKKISIQNTVPDKVMVIADPVFLEQVFCNLLTNAIKFSGRGKAITIRFSPGENMIFAVEDNGIGIAPDLMKDIFSYHEKTSTRGTMGETGTGFGLPLSNDIMEALNGKLKAEPRPGGGSSFLVILPNPKPHILIMENSPGSCDSLKDLLEKEGFMVTANSYALRVLELLEHMRFDFLLVQLSATKDTGSELIRLVAGNDKLKGMPILTIGDSKCYKRISDDELNGVIDCGIENSKVVAAIYSTLMDGGREK